MDGPAFLAAVLCGLDKLKCRRRSEKPWFAFLLVFSIRYKRFRSANNFLGKELVILGADLELCIPYKGIPDSL